MVLAYSLNKYMHNENTGPMWPCDVFVLTFVNLLLSFCCFFNSPSNSILHCWLLHLGNWPFEDEKLRSSLPHGTFQLLVKICCWFRCRGRGISLFISSKIVGYDQYKPQNYRFCFLPHSYFFLLVLLSPPPSFPSRKEKLIVGRRWAGEQAGWHVGRAANRGYPDG